MTRSNGNAIDKLPPQNIEAEKSLLGSLLLDKEAINRVADSLRPEDFYGRAHQLIYEGVAKLFEKREPIDLLSLSNVLEESGHLETVGGVGYLTALVNSVPTSAHVAHYGKIVQRKKVLRDLIDTAHHIIGLGYQEDEDVDVLLDQAEQKLFSISQRSIQQTFQPISAALHEAFERLDMLHKGDGKLRGAATGFVDLDNLIAGLQKSDLIILGARPSLGKSTLALDIARNVAKTSELPVGLFTLEMSKDQVIDRLISSEAGISLWKLRTGRLSSDGDDNDFEKIQAALDNLAKSNVFIDDASSPTVLQIRAMARRLQADKGLGLIVVDYLQLIQPSRAYDSPVQQVTEISRHLKGLARELNIPVLAVSQLSRNAESRPDQRPKLSDLRDSGCVTGDTEIIDAETGQVYMIEELALSKKQIKVWSLNDQLKLQKSRLIKTFPSGVKTIFELKLRSGRTIKTSANHPFYSFDGWLRLDELIPGQKIAVPRLLPESLRSSKFANEKLIVLAHLIGDGCYVKRQPLHYTSADPECLKIVGQSAKRVFGVTAKLVKQENWFHLYLSRGPHRFNPLLHWLKSLDIYGQRSHQKEIPGFVFSLNQKQAALFLQHLWATDGDVYFTKSSDNYVIYYSTTSRKLAGQVQTLLLRLGILSTIRTSRKKGYRINYNVHVQGKENQLLFLNKIGIYGKKSRFLAEALKFLNKKKANPNLDVIPKEVWKRIAIIKENYNLSWRDVARTVLKTSYCGSTLFKHGVSRARMARIAAYLKDPILLKLQNSDIFWDEIISIKKIGEAKVYDATIEATHNFIANNIFIHNSLEQDADLVMFIYREDRVKKDTDKKNIAEIIIAKHRNGPVGSVELYFDEEPVTFKNLAKNF